MVTAAGAATLSAREDLTLHLAGDDQRLWDVFVRACPESSFCHLWNWRGIMSDVLGHECWYWVALDRDGGWRGVLPLVDVRSRLFGHYLISMPFLNAGGPVGSGEARALLAARAVDEARRRGADLLELRGREPLGVGLRDAHRKITVVLDLPADAEELWRKFPPKLRSQIRKPLKARCEVRFGPMQLDAFYRVFARHMRDLGTPVLPRAFFEAIARGFPERVLFGTVQRDGKPLAVGCGFLWHGGFELTWAAALRNHQAEAPNMLLYWSFMQQAIARGITRFDFGRCTPGGGTHRFKQQWGGYDLPLPWAQWSANGVAAPPSPERPHYRLAAAVWSCLPQAVTDRLGPRLARLLP